MGEIWQSLSTEIWQVGEHQQLSFQLIAEAN